MSKISRRDFLKTIGGAGLIASTVPSTFLTDLYAFSTSANLSQVEAWFYKKLPDKEIKCELCPRYCKLGDKERGYCGVRENKNGIYYTLVYGKVCAAHIDPIEKKPFFHFLPGTPAFSIATAGCNVNCKFCQNWQISQVRPEQVENVDLPPRDVVRYCLKYRCPTIAYTYTEPVIFYEYVYDTSVEASKKRIRNVVVTGAHINPEPMEKLTKVVDAIKIDFKAFSEDFYQKYVRGELEPVLEAARIVKKSGKWMEIVYLVIPTLNDSPEEIRKMCKWVIKDIGPDVPVHFSRFHPMYLIKNLPPTPVSTLERARNIALEEGINYVYIGNVPGHMAESTYCPNCKNIVIKRFAYQILQKNLKRGKCKFCGQPIPGVWS
ncbi:AmmeMemoRadiSam system radical SAM enzyme [Candidatus Aminicenantes bacterium AH-873-B07]|jgi:pyruvate formate lyase activating enzyme|nr:AmmeMemoRadiSam system radical SAM enzyme [Candidatus Aminicenantes bacterium AH-873-B07]